MKVFIGLGSNLGEREAMIRQALEELTRLPATQLLRASSLYDTEPVGEVDLELEPTDDRAEKSDRLADAVDYDLLNRTVREVVEGRSFHLLESLAAATAESVLERFAVRRVKVRIAKQNLGWSTGGRAVIEVVRERRV